MYNLRSRQTRNDQKPKNSNPPAPKPVKPVKAVKAKTVKPAKPAKRGKPRDRVPDEPKQNNEDNDVDLDETIPIEEYLENLKRKGQEDEPSSENKAKKAKIETPKPIETSGLVMTFGDDFCGELGLKKTGFTKKRPVLVEGIQEKVTQIVCGGMHNVCLTTDGEIYTWGCNDEGALGRKTDNPPKGRNLEAEPDKVPLLSKIKKVTAGDSHSAALTTNGEIHIWGNFKDSTGNIGIKPDSDETKGQFQPIRVELPNTNFVDLASGTDHILLLTDAGVVYSLGSGEQGQLGRLEKSEWKEIKNNRDIFLKPAIVKFEDKSISFDNIWAGQYSSFARAKNGDIFAWGLNNYSQLGIPQTTTNQDDLIVPFPIQISSLSKLNGQIEQICQGQHFMLVRDSTGKVYSCGRHEYGRLGHGKVEESLTEPKLIEKLDSENIKCIATGSINSFAVNDKGQLYSWGMSGASLGLGDDDVWEPTLVESKNLSTHNVISVSAGSAHTVIIVSPKSD